MNLSGTTTRCRVNQNPFDFFTGNVICMHACLVFLFLALGFMQLLISLPPQPLPPLFFFPFFSGCYKLNAYSGKNICCFPKTAWQFIESMMGSYVLIMAALMPANRILYKQRVCSSLVHYNSSFSSSLQLTLAFKSWKHAGGKLPKYLWTMARVRVRRAANEIKDLHHKPNWLINHSLPSCFCCLKKRFF